LHACSRVDARFDEPNLVSAAGLVPLMLLAAGAGRSVRDVGELGGRVATGASGAGDSARPLPAGLGWWSWRRR
jgi:hypothetical protein